MQRTQLLPPSTVILYVRIPPALREALVRVAIRDRTSMQAVVTDLLTKATSPKPAAKAKRKAL